MVSCSGSLRFGRSPLPTETRNESGDLRYGLVKAIDETHDVVVGKGDIDAARAAAEQWERVGWRVIIAVGASGRRTPLRVPYTPVRCDRCRWAGLNLGTHYARSHPGCEPPEGPKVAEVCRKQTRAARAVMERNRRPRRGVLVVRQPSDSVAMVYRIERVERSKGLVHLYPFQSAPYRGDGLIVVRLDELLTSYLPVGRWSR